MRSLFLLVLVGCISIPRVPPDRRLAPEQIATAVTVMTDCEEDGPFGELSLDHNKFGSGVIISERHVLTAAHVADCKGATLPRTRVRLADGRQFMVAIDKIDHKLDLARLEIASHDRFKLKVPPPLIGQTPAKGDSICIAAGFPGRAWSCGFVEQAFSTGFLHGAVTRLGNSGSGTYDINGALLGIVVGRLKADPSIGIVQSLVGLDSWVYGLHYD